MRFESWLITVVQNVDPKQADGHNPIRIFTVDFIDAFVRMNNNSDCIYCVVLYCIVLYCIVLY